MKSILLTLLLIQVLTSFSQKNAREEFFLYDANFNPIPKPDTATYLMRVQKLHDTLYQWDTYNINGPMVSSEQFRDHDGTKPNGIFSFYHRSGYVDSSGQVQNGFPHGDWGYCNDTGRVMFIKTYNMGKLVKSRDLMEEERIRIANGDTLNTLNDDEQESSFPGGSAQWQSYLIKNLKYPQRAHNLMKDGVISVQFIIDTAGQISNITLHKSVEYSLDQEEIRIIRHSPEWKPAVQKGKLVKSYKRQPIVFRLE